MPYVFVKYRKEAVSEAVLESIQAEIRGIVAIYLSVTNHELRSDDVEVFFSEFNDKDLTTRDVQVIVQGHPYPERLEMDLEHTAKMIARDIHEATPSGLPNIAVWIQLPAGGYFGNKSKLYLS